jgi:Na+/melibiose symporter-like transporter
VTEPLAAGATLSPAQGLRYGLLGLPLAFVALPLAVYLPSHYAAFGLPLASLGVLLLALRLLDAVADPWIGRRVGTWLNRGGVLLGVRLGAAGLLLALAFAALMFPPLALVLPSPGFGHAALLLWCGLCLVLCYAAYSGLSILHQAWGARLGGDAAGRSAVVAWREGFGLLGVVVASVLPSVLGWATACAVLALSLGAAVLALGRLGLTGVRAGSASASPGESMAAPATLHPLRHAGFRRLLLVYALNGVAAAVPATLVLFFIRDRLQAQALEPLLLGLYFLAAGLGLPLWVRAARRWGLLRSWAAGMVLAMLSFIGTLALGPGNGPVFALICAASGLALGADLTFPPALLAGLLAELPRSKREPAQPEPDEGLWFGWWTVVTKLNLALAAGLGLPLLQALGYQPGGQGAEVSQAGLQALSLVYGLLPCGLLPCGLKLAALASLLCLARSAAAVQKDFA